MYRIGEFSKMAKTTIKTLRYYDREGLLSPARVDEETGYRYYTTGQLIRLSRITALRQAGLSVGEVASILSGQDRGELLRRRQTETEDELKEMESRLSRIRHLLARTKEDFFMEYQAIIKELPACTVFYKQGVVPTFADYTAFILKAGEECREANPHLKCVEPSYCYTTYLDPEFRQHDIAVEYAQAVTARGQETDTIHFKDIEKTQAVCVYHRGRYESLGEAYAYAFNWMEENGYEAAGSAREQYIDGVWNKESQEDFLTEIQIPARRK